MDIEFLAQLRKVARLEAFSTLVLFGIAMPLKYLAGLPIAVSIVGPIHGVLFVLFVVMCMLGVERIPMSKGLATAGIVSAFFPFGPFLIDGRFAALSEDR